MFQFDIPLIFDKDYIEYINFNSNKFSSCYFSLYSSLIPDARNADISIDFELIKNILPKINIEKYLLMNSRFTYPELYTGPYIKQIIKMIDQLEISGIIYSDQYLITLLSNYSKSVCNRLKLIPSINFQIDSYDKFQNIYDSITKLNFQLPSNMILDRNLNRQFHKCEELSNVIKSNYQIKITLLANEGCLYYCPFKTVHDSLISLSHFPKSFTLDLAQNINSVIGCTYQYLNNPSQILKSPFIRPEDLLKYSNFIDSFKLSGRTFSSHKLIKILDSYISGEFSGNLLELLDSQYSLSKYFYVFNDSFPDDFLNKVSTCSKNCNTCNYCQTLIFKT